MQKKFCPRCGKYTDEFYDNLCADCFLKKMNVSKFLPEKLTVYLCKVCGRYYVNNKHFNSLESAIDNLLMNLLKQKELKSATYRIDDEKIIVTLKASVGKHEKLEEKKLNLIQKETVCKFCKMEKSGYYRVILQIRVPKSIEQEILQDVKSQMEKINLYDDLGFISEIKKLKEGIDLYIGSKSAAHSVVSFLKKKYKAKTKVSSKIFGEESGKKVYRDTILVSIK